MKVWIYKGDILPYKLSSEDKISREAAMAAGETSGAVGPAPPRHRRWRTPPGRAGRARQRAHRSETRPRRPRAPTGDGWRPATREPPTRAVETASAPLPGAAPAGDDFERLLAEEEEIERRTRNEHHETPHFRKESD